MKKSTEELTQIFNECKTSGFVTIDGEPCLVEYYNNFKRITTLDTSYISQFQNGMWCEWHEVSTEHKDKILKIDGTALFGNNNVNDIPSLNYTFPEEGERVLALFKGEWIVLEVGVESPSFEESFESFKYWFEPFSDMLCIEAHDVDAWVPLPEIPTMDDNNEQM